MQEVTNISHPQDSYEDPSITKLRQQVIETTLYRKPIKPESDIPSDQERAIKPVEEATDGSNTESLSSLLAQTLDNIKSEKTVSKDQEILIEKICDKENTDRIGDLMGRLMS